MAYEGSINRVMREQRIGLEDNIAMTTRRLAMENERLTRELLAEWEGLLGEIEGLRAAGKEITIGRIYRTERYRALALQTAQRYEEYAKKIGQELDPALMRAVEQGSRDMQALTREALGALPAGVNESLLFTKLPTEALNNIVATTTSGPLAEILNEYGAGGRLGLTRTLRQGLAEGLHPRIIAKHMARYMEGNLARAACIARTEIHRAYREAQRQQMRAMKRVVTGWVWHADLSGGTCAACWAMHGQKFDTDTPMGTHPNCRCTMMPVTRSAQDIAAQYGINVSPAARESNPFLAGEVRTGPDVFADLTDAEQLHILGPKAFDAFKRGEFELPDIVREVETPKWGVTRSKASVKQARANARKRGHGPQPPTPPPPPPPPTPTPIAPTPPANPWGSGPKPDWWVDKKPLTQATIRTDTDLGRRVQARINEGFTTVDDVRAVGRMIREEANCTLSPEAAAKWDRWAELNEKRYMTKGGLDYASGESAEYFTLDREFMTNPFGEFATNGPYPYQQRLEAALNDVRDFGEGAVRNFPNGSGTIYDHFDYAAQRYPRDWLENSASKEWDVEWHGVRSHYSSGARRIRINRNMTEATQRQVMRHEVAHRMEAVRPEMQEILTDFRKDRGFKSKRTKDGLKHGDRGGEDLIRDNFQHEYAGRTYGESRQAFSEVLSMGQEGLWWNPSEGRETPQLIWDQDYTDFILGLLAGA